MCNCGKNSKVNIKKPLSQKNKSLDYKKLSELPHKFSFHYDVKQSLNK